MREVLQGHEAEALMWLAMVPDADDPYHHVAMTLAPAFSAVWFAKESNMLLGCGQTNTSKVIRKELDKWARRILFNGRVTARTVYSHKLRSVSPSGF